MVERFALWLLENELENRFGSPEQRREAAETFARAYPNWPS